MVTCGMTKSTTTAANLFTAAKANFIAARMILPSVTGTSAAATIPFYFLTGFSIELALKAVVLRVNNDQEELRNLKHDLRKALRSAEACGLPFVAPEIHKMITRMSESHAGLSFRYIPDVESIDVVGPGLLDALLARLLANIEGSIDVWEDQPTSMPLVVKAPNSGPSSSG